MPNIIKTHKKVDIPPKPDWWKSDKITGDQIITINWNNQHNAWWSNMCADVVEVFGLPGKRFYYKPQPDCMMFTFKSKKDADLCKILLSDRL